MVRIFNIPKPKCAEAEKEFHLYILKLESICKSFKFDGHNSDFMKFEVSTSSEKEYSQLNEFLNSYPYLGHP